MRQFTRRRELAIQNASDMVITRSAIPIPTRRQALEQARRSPGFSGICIECGCTENNACTRQGFLEDECYGWANEEKTLCTNRTCMQQAAERAAGKLG